MKKALLLIALAAIVILANTNRSNATPDKSAPHVKTSVDKTDPTSKFPDERTRAVVEQLIEAHGGMDAWLNSTVVSFRHTVFMPSMPKQFPKWMISTDTIQQGSRKGYSVHPLWNARIANDNEKVWSTNWRFPNAPSQMLGIHYYFAFLPWLSQDEGVVFDTAVSAKLPGDDTEYTRVDFWYENDGSEKPDIWSLFADPSSGMMKGFAIQFKQGKAIHVIDDYTDASGLKIPSEFTTYTGAKFDQIIGYHVIVDATLHATFDDNMLKMVDGAVVEE